MEIAPSLLSQSLYGEKGKVVVPLSFYMKQNKERQFGGGKKNIEHLGVPLVLALVNVNVFPDKTQHNSMLYELNNEPQPYSLSENENIVLKNEPEQHMHEYSPISDGVYDSLLNSILDEQIQSQSQLSKYPSMTTKKYTRKMIK